MGTLLAVVSVLVICVATLTPVHGSGGGGTSRICLICHARGMADFLSNVILFAPLGVGLALRGWSLWRAALASMLFSFGIELLQFQIVAGRDSNFGDLVANSLGGVVGWWVGSTLSWWTPRPAGEVMRSTSLAALAALILLGGLSLLRPAPLATTYYLQWTADLGGLDHYDGRVLSTAIGPLALAGPGRISQSDSVRQLLRAPAWGIELIAGTSPWWIAPIVSIYDEDQQEIVLLGALGEDVVYRQRLLAGALRLDEPDIRIPNALEGLRPGERASIAYRADRAVACATVNEREHCRRTYAVGDTWALLLFPDSWDDDGRALVSVLWLFAAFIPAGFTAYRARTAALSGFLVASLLLAGPALMGYVTTPVPQLVAALSGLAAGFGAARAVVRVRRHVRQT